MTYGIFITRMDRRIAAISGFFRRAAMEVIIFFVGTYVLIRIISFVHGGYGLRFEKSDVSFIGDMFFSSFVFGFF